MDKQAFEVFVRDEYRWLVRFAETLTENKEDAEDAVQDALTFVWRVLTGQKRWVGPRPVTTAYIRKMVIDRAKGALRSRKDRRLDASDEVMVLNRLYNITPNYSRRVPPRKGAD